MDSPSQIAQSPANAATAAKPFASPGPTAVEYYQETLVRLIERAKILCSHFNRITISIDDILFSIDSENRANTHYQMVWLGNESESDDDSSVDEAELSSIETESTITNDSTEENTDEADDIDEIQETETIDSMAQADAKIQDTETLDRSTLRPARALSQMFYTTLAERLQGHEIEFEAANCLESYLEDQYHLFVANSSAR